MARRGTKPVRGFSGLLEARWKAVVALLVPLAGGLVALSPDSRGWQVVGVVAAAAATAAGVHQVPNKARAPGPEPAE